MVTSTNSEQGVQHPSVLGVYEQQPLPGSLDRVSTRRTSSTEQRPLERLGRLAVRAWCAGQQLASGLLSPRELLMAAAEVGDAALAEEIAIVASHLAALGTLTEQSHERLFTEIARFVRRLDLLHVEALAAVTASHTRDFVHEPVDHRDRWADPGLGTMHFRRSAVRLLFRAARQLYLVKHDPTLDLVLPARSALQTRPLHDDEEMLCRVACRQTLIATRLPAAWALGQATAVSSELAVIRASDVDLDAGTVLLHGCSKRVPRVGVLTPWGVEQLRRHISQLAGNDCPLVYGAQTSSVSGQASSCSALHDVLRHAGLSGEPDVRPGSLAAWAGRRIFEETGLEREVARALGIRSLDRAAQVIGWDWSA
ncbi:MAG: hypothetical protein M3346_00710 [Actinomycetota bacterium]|nr:hypothetical protein [Actinomycetota bacterium]